MSYDCNSRSQKKKKRRRSNPTDFDVNNITQTSQKADNFKTKISIEGYESFFTPWNSEKGGSALFLKSAYDSFERVDLKTCTDDFDSIWIEIKNKNELSWSRRCIENNFKNDRNFMITVK